VDEQRLCTHGVTQTSVGRAAGMSVLVLVLSSVLLSSGEMGLADDTNHRASARFRDANLENRS